MLLGGEPINSKQLPYADACCMASWAIFATWGGGRFYADFQIVMIKDVSL